MAPIQQLWFRNRSTMGFSGDVLIVRYKSPSSPSSPTEAAQRMKTLSCSDSQNRKKIPAGCVSADIRCKPKRESAGSDRPFIDEEVRDEPADDDATATGQCKPMHRNSAHGNQTSLKQCLRTLSSCFLTSLLFCFLVSSLSCFLASLLPCFLASFPP